MIFLGILLRSGPFGNPFRSIPFRSSKYSVPFLEIFRSIPQKSVPAIKNI